MLDIVLAQVLGMAGSRLAHGGGGLPFVPLDITALFIFCKPKISARVQPGSRLFPLSEDVALNEKEGYYILYLCKNKKMHPQGLWLGCGRRNMEDLAESITHEPLGFEPFDVGTDGTPKGGKITGKRLCSHVILNCGFGELCLAAAECGGFLFQLFQGGDSRLNGGYIPAGVKAHFRAGEEIHHSCGYILVGIRLLLSGTKHGSCQEKSAE